MADQDPPTGTGKVGKVVVALVVLVGAPAHAQAISSSQIQKRILTHPLPVVCDCPQVHTQAWVQVSTFLETKTTV